MKVVLITVGDLKYSPYIISRIEMLKKNNIQHDIIYWNRDGDEREYQENEFVYKYESSYSSNKTTKLFSFLGYLKFVKNIIKSKSYKRLFVYTSQCAVLLKSVLLKKYKASYILDIRDLSLESFMPFKFIQSKVINNSVVTFVSSEGFLEKLPASDKYLLTHNVQADMINMELRKTTNKTMPIKIAYLGVLRDYSGIINFIKLIGNDNRFIFNIHGSGTFEKDIAKYVADKQYTNVFMHGYYKMNQKESFMKDADIMMNFYESARNILATTNKYYDAIFAGIPQVTNKKTFNNSLVEKYAVGVGVDLDKDKSDVIYDYYTQLNNVDFLENCNKAKIEILDDISSNDKKILNILDIS